MEDQFFANASAVDADLNYQGQAGYESLRTHCNSGIDIVTLAFVNNSPESQASGYPGTNFAGHCGAATYNNTEGVSSNLLSECVDIINSISYCQDQGVKVLLSIGGVYSSYSNYTVSSTQNGQKFAEFLYKAFGPYDASWHGPRPFDNGTHRTHVDGFDFDIEGAFGMSAP